MRRLSIGALLGMLVGVLVVLATAIGVLNGALGLRIVESRAEQSARQLAQTAAVSLTSYLEDAEASLRYLASVDPGGGGTREECRERLAHAGNLMSEFFQVGRFAADGSLVCASAPIPEDIEPTLANEPWFEALRGSDTLVVAPPIRVEEIDAWVSPLAYPVRSDDGSFAGAYLGTVDLSRFQRLLRAIQLPEEGLITVSRIRDAMVVARTQDAEEWVGRRIGNPDLTPEELRRGGVNRTEGMDGVSRIWGFQAVDPAGWVVFAGFPVRWIQGPAWTVIVGTGALTLAFLGIAIFLVIRVRRTIVGSVGELVRQSRSAALGEVSRISVEGPTELRELAGAFNRTLDDRAALDRRLREAEKTEALARLSAGVAHDFRNLLTVITGEASLGAAELAPDHPIRENLDAIHDAATEAADVTRKLLAFSQQAPEEAGAVDLNAAVRDEVRLLSVNLGEEHAIHTDLASDLPPVLGDERRIDVILRELVENAVEAQPEGGVIEVETGPGGPGSEDGTGTEDVNRVPPMAAYVEVRDSGRGMRPGVRQRLFEPFFTTKPRDRGSGMGMPTVLGLTRQIGGRVDVESEPGRGTRVRVWFPHPGSEDHDAPVTPITPMEPSGDGT